VVALVVLAFGSGTVAGPLKASRVGHRPNQGPSAHGQRAQTGRRVTVHRRWLIPLPFPVKLSVVRQPYL